MTDFLFVPGSSGPEVMGRTVISHRPNTTLITRPAAQNHLAGLIAHLTTSGSITRPIGDILLVAHGLETGFYFMPLSRALPSPAHFESAETANTSNAVRMTAPLLTPAGGGPMNTITVRMRGCNIGQARPFVEKLQEAMTPSGGTLNVTAPLHFDEFHGTRGGHIEYLAHKFTLKVNQRFADRNALIAAFAANTAFTYLNGTQVPLDVWQSVVPATIHPAPASWRQSFNMGVGLNPAIGTQTTATIHREYRYETLSSPFSWDWRAPDPGTRALRLDVLRNSLPQGTVSGVHIFDPTYPWPQYERFGFASINDYVNGLDWVITFTGGVLHFRATRHEYTVMLPITDPPGPPPSPGGRRPDPVLRLYNFFPATAAAGPAAFNLDETNTNLFLNL